MKRLLLSCLVVLLSTSAYCDTITFATDTLQSICLAHWDADNDSLLTSEELAAVDSIGTIFQGNKAITTFHELGYFTGLKLLEPNAFADCTALTAITLPASLDSIGSAAFANDTLLTTIKSRIKTIEKGIPDDAFPQVVYDSCQLIVPLQMKEVYETTDGWKNFKHITEMESGDDPEEEEPEEEVQPITVTVKDYSREYGELNPDFEYEVTDGEAVGRPEIYCDADRYSPVGTYPIMVLTGTLSNDSVILVDGTLTITEAPLVIKAGDYTMVEGDELPKFEAIYEGFKNKETVDVLIKKPKFSCSATSYFPAGEYTVRISDAEAENYAISYVSGKLTITPAPYDGIDFATGVAGYHELSKTTAALTDGSNAKDKFEMPSTVSYQGVNYTVTAIGEAAFLNNVTLNEISIPGTVSAIGDKAFAGCSNLRGIEIYVVNPISLKPAEGDGVVRVFEGVDKNRCVLYVPKKAIEAYKNAEGWREFNTIISIGSTDIDGITTDEESLPIYDLSGRRVGIEGDSQSGLRKGVYIIGRRKVVR